MCRAARDPQAIKGGFVYVKRIRLGRVQFRLHGKTSFDTAEKNCTSALYITIIISTANVESLCPFSFTQLAECHILSKPRRKAIHHRMAWTEMQQL
jgi:hypothetical protein